MATAPPPRPPPCSPRSRESRTDPLAAILERAHRAARATRGAAATCVRVDLAARTAVVAGVGNVAAWIVTDHARQLVTQHGTLGQVMPRQLREETHPFPPEATLVVCTDGLKSRLGFDDAPDLPARRPMTIAATLWRDHNRGRDDATVAVVRECRMIELGLVDLRIESDVVRAHQTTRMIASQLGFTTFEQTRIATAMSEIARNALTYASGGSVAFGLDDAGQALTIIVSDRGPGIANLDAIMAGQHHSSSGLGIGIAGARRLMDDLAIETTPAGTRVEMTKRVPRRGGKIEPGQIGHMRSQLAGQLADDPTQEIRRLQRDIAERDQRIADLSDEIHETNRGVMALHTELEDRAAYQREAVELRTRLLREMGHEIRTPLHSIATISQFLIERQDGELTDEQDKQVRIIQEVTESLTSYVNDLLDLARTDAGRAIVHAKAFAASDLLKGLRRVLQPLVPGPIVLRFEVAELPLLVTDEQKLSQILRNLIANAIKFTERGTIEVRAFRAGIDHVRFEVSDTGSGIAPEHHELVFREFAQVDGEVQARLRGSGLGLPLSRRLAELLGGTLTVTSAIGEGSVFRLDIPIVCDDAVRAHPATAEITPVETRAAPGRRRALVIDDDVASRYVLKRWLADRYEVAEAASGRDGLRSADAHPDVIFLDVVMPDLTGFEVLEHLKSNPATREIPVIVYSALVLGSNDRERLAAAVAILRKSTSSRVADRAAIEDALVKAGVAIPVENTHV